MCHIYAAYYLLSACDNKPYVPLVLILVVLVWMFAEDNTFPMWGALLDIYVQECMKIGVFKPSSGGNFMPESQAEKDKETVWYGSTYMNVACNSVSVSDTCLL